MVLTPAAVRSAAGLLLLVGLLLPACRPDAPSPSERLAPGHSGTTTADGPVELSGRTMGTTWSVLLLPSGQLDKAQLTQRVQRLLDELEQVFSHYRPDSELSHLNRSPEGMVVSEHMARVVACALRINQQSDGALDVTVAPLVRLWGFGPQPAGTLPPSPEQLRQARRRVGSRWLRLELEASGAWYVRKLRPELTLDLSAVAKGYAVDCVCRLLDRAGVRHYLVGIGGEYRCRGRHPRGRPWRIGLEVPHVAATGAVYQQVGLPSGWAVATSGTYRQRRGKAHHLIDPRTGRPASHPTVAVTVLAPACMEADAWATALLVLGAGQGLPLARQRRLAAVFVRRRGSAWKVLTTEQFDHLARSAPAPR